MKAITHAIKCMLDNPTTDTQNVTYDDTIVTVINTKDGKHYVSYNTPNLATATFGFTSYRIEHNTVSMYWDGWNVGRLTF